MFDNSSILLWFIPSTSMLDYPSNSKLLLYTLSYCRGKNSPKQVTYRYVATDLFDSLFLVSCRYWRGLSVAITNYSMESPIILDFYLFLRWIYIGDLLQSQISGSDPDKCSVPDLFSIGDIDGFSLTISYRITNSSPRFAHWFLFSILGDRSRFRYSRPLWAIPLDF